MSVIDAHGKKFNGKGIANDDIPDYVFEAVYQRECCWFTRKANPRTIYEFTYNGVTQRIAVQVSENGYIVADPKRMKIDYD